MEWDLEQMSAAVAVAVVGGLILLGLSAVITRMHKEKMSRRSEVVTGDGNGELRFLKVLAQAVALIIFFGVIGTSIDGLGLNWVMHNTVSERIKAVYAPPPQPMMGAHKVELDNPGYDSRFRAYIFNIGTDVIEDIRCEVGFSGDSNIQTTRQKSIPPVQRDEDILATMRVSLPPDDVVKKWFIDNPSVFTVNPPVSVPGRKTYTIIITRVYPGEVFTVLVWVKGRIHEVDGSCTVAGKPAGDFEGWQLGQTSRREPTLLYAPGRTTSTTLGD